MNNGLDEAVKLYESCKCMKGPMNWDEELRATGKFVKPDDVIFYWTVFTVGELLHSSLEDKKQFENCSSCD